MKKVLLSAILAISALSLVPGEADARRLGGGGSFGKQSSNVSRQAMPAQPAAARPAAPAAAAAPGAAAPKPASPWRGILGGALLGLGVGALLSSMGLGGMGGMLGSILMIALLAGAAFFIFRMIKRRNENANDNATQTPAYASGDADRFKSDAPFAKTSTPEIGAGLKSSTPEIGSGLQSGYGTSAALNAPAADGATWTIPADFDVPPFLRNAKTYFIRLQAAWDKADLNDIREFTTTEMFAEFRLELQERGVSTNVTDVVKLEAEMLGVETVGSDHLASVKFTGLIKEDAAADAAPFAEVWNLSKPANGQGGWVLAGIQQL